MQFTAVPLAVDGCNAAQHFGIVNDFIIAAAVSVISKTSTLQILSIITLSINCPVIINTLVVEIFAIFILISLNKN